MSHLDDYFLGSDILGAEPGTVSKANPKAAEAANKAISAASSFSRKLPKISKKLAAQGKKLLGKANQIDKSNARKDAADKKAAKTAAASSAVAPEKASTAASKSTYTPTPTVAPKTAARTAVVSPPAPVIAPKAAYVAPAPAPAPVVAPKVTYVAPAPVSTVPKTTYVAPKAPVKTSVRTTSVRGLDASMMAAASTLSIESTAMHAFVAMGWALDPCVDLVNKLDARNEKAEADRGFAILSRGDAAAMDFDIDSANLSSTISTMQAVTSDAQAWAVTARELLAQEPPPATPEEAMAQGIDPFASSSSYDGGGGYGGGGADPFADEGGGFEDYGGDFDPNAAMDAATDGGDPSGGEGDASYLEQEFLENQAAEAEAQYAESEQPVSEEAPAEDTESQPITFSSPFKKVTDEKWTEFVNAMRTAELGDVSESNALGAFQMKPRRLEDLGYMKSVVCKRAPNGRMIWVGDFKSPLTSQKFLTNPDIQYKAFLASMRDYKNRLKKGEIPKPSGGIVEGTTLSGVLAVLHRAGPKGLDSFADPEKRFEETTKLFEIANGIF